jgi:hypothetical protein
MSKADSVRRISASAVIACLTAAMIGVLAPAALAAPTVNCGAGQDLQAKINAVSGGTIYVKGTCYGNFTISGKNLSLVGKPSATLDGTNTGFVVLMGSANTLHLSNLTVTNGSFFLGGGVLSVGNLFLNHVTVSNNVSSGEGAGVASFSAVNVNSSKILNNHVLVVGSGGGSPVEGAGGGVIASGNITVTGSTVQGNTVAVANNPGRPEALGGGLLGFSAIHVTNSKILKNEVGTTGDGGLAFGAAVWNGSTSSGVGPTVVSKSVVSGNVAGAVSSSSNTAEAGATIVTGDVTGSTSTGGPLTVQNSTISGNRTVVDGGSSATVEALPGLVSDFNSLTVTNSLIQGNTGTAKATSGDAVVAFTALLADADLTVNGSRITGNTGKADSTGGNAVGEAYALGATLTMTKSTVDRNGFTATSGGAEAVAEIGVGSNTINVNTSTISRNFMNVKTTAASLAEAIGPGLFDGTGTVKNSTIALNTVKATSPGSGASVGAGAGAFLGTSSPTTVTESTVAGNSISIFGGGGSNISLGGGVFGNNQVTLKDSIVALNKAVTGPDCYQDITSGGYNLIGKTAGCAFTSSTGDKLNKNPLLLPLGNYGGPTETMLPSPTSPVVNAVPNGSCPIKSDQRGVKRPQGTKCDMGADERTSKDPTKSATVAAPTTGFGSSGSLAARFSAERVLARAGWFLGSGTGALHLGGTGSGLSSWSALRQMVARAVAGR